jgi:hypothetical protein
LIANDPPERDEWITAGIYLLRDLPGPLELPGNSRVNRQRHGQSDDGQRYHPFERDQLRLIPTPFNQPPR